jgi:hypothetical protein
LIPFGATGDSSRLFAIDISILGKHVIVPALVGIPTNDRVPLESDKKVIVPLTDPPTIQSASELDKWYRISEMESKARVPQSIS